MKCVCQEMSSFPLWLSQMILTFLILPPCCRNRFTGITPLQSAIALVSRWSAHTTYRTSQVGYETWVFAQPVLQSGTKFSLAVQVWTNVLSFHSLQLKKNLKINVHTFSFICLFDILPMIIYNIVQNICCSSLGQSYSSSPNDISFLKRYNSKVSKFKLRILNHSVLKPV